MNGQVASIGTPVGLGDCITTELAGESIFSVGADAFLVRGASEVELSGDGVVAQTLSVLTAISVIMKALPAAQTSQSAFKRMKNCYSLTTV